jgi:hypothetical protein
VRKPGFNKSRPDPSGDREKEMILCHRSTEPGENFIHHLRLHGEEEDLSLGGGFLIIGQGLDAIHLVYYVEAICSDVGRDHLFRANLSCLEEAFDQGLAHVPSADERDTLIL